MLTKRIVLGLLAVFLSQGYLAAQAQGGAPSNGEPYKLHTEENQQMPGSSYPAYPSYPAPKMLGTPKKAPPPKHEKPIQAKVEMQVPKPVQPPPQRPPLQASVQASPPPGVLPNGLMGSWLVLGSRAKVTARPEYQNGIENIFSATNSQTWNIAGNPGSYSMSADTGVSQVQVGNCTATTGYIRYQHPIKNTLAQEVIVMQLSPDGKSFQGMQRITIVKPGESGPPRAMVQYNLSGRRN